MKNILITCPICGEKFKSLSSHVYFKHHIKPDELRVKYPDVILVIDSVKKKTSRTCIKSGCGKWMKGYEFPENRKREYSKKFGGGNNPFHGKKHTLGTKKKMSKNHADFNGKKNPLVKWLAETPKNREEYSRCMRAVWAREDLAELLSKRNRQNMVNAIANGNHHPYSNHEHGWITSAKFNQKFYYQSSYERRFLKFCENSSKISSLQRSKSVIPYVDNDGKERIYNPDFLVNGKLLVEIKPQSMMPLNNNAQKIRVGKKYCEENGLEFRLITEPELKQLPQMLWNG